MKEKLAILLASALEKIAGDCLPEGASLPEVSLSIPKHKAHGDYATNLAMVVAGMANKAPREIALALVDAIGDGGGLIARAEVAGPGFINFFLNKAGIMGVLARIEEEGESFGRVQDGPGKRVLVEFVSANPTGPLHVGHGRGAVYGDALASLLDAAGFQVQREYYINDAGLQVQILGRSTFLRYRQLIEGVDGVLEDGLYQGDYIREHAAALRKEKGDELGLEDISQIAQWTAHRIMEEIKRDLGDSGLGVRFDSYFSEKTNLLDTGAVAGGLEALKARGLTFDEGGALWFRSKSFGDDKDRVLVKSSGEKTYLASDVAYHKEKMDRGFDELIDIWGADHHGYIQRVKAVIQAFGKPPEVLTVILVQMVNLIRSGRRVSMSTRAGEFVTLRELVEEVGRDAARFFFLTRRPDSQLDFDVDLAKERSNQNPVYYVQYMHARICSIFHKAQTQGVEIPRFADIDVTRLAEPEEARLARHLAEFPELVRRAAKEREPHRLTTYLSELAGIFHPYYFRHRIIGEDQATSAARLHLCGAVRQVARNALHILGIDAPESM